MNQQVDFEAISMETLNQMGGMNNLRAMIGAKHFTYSGKKTGFRFAKFDKKINHVEITLNDQDLYDMKFWWIYNTTCKELNEIKGIYGDDLQRIFSEETGLTLQMPVVLVARR